MPNVGVTELLIILAVVLIIFGPKKLPQLGRSLGGGLREFKGAVTGRDKDDDEPEVIEGPDSANVTTTEAAEDEDTETAQRKREAKTADAS